MLMVTLRNHETIINLTFLYILLRQYIRDVQVQRVCAGIIDLMKQ